MSRRRARRTEPGARAAAPGLLAWAVYDWGSNAFPTIVQTFIFAAYFTREVAADERVGTALWGNALGVAGLVVALGGPLLGAIADQKGRHKPWIGAFTLVAVAATASLWFVYPSADYVWRALLLLGIGTVASHLAFIFYNSMLPRIAAPSRFGRWSGWGWSAGYAGGLLCLVVAWLAFVREGAWFALDRDTAAHVRATFVLAAGWYLVFALPLFLLTPDAETTGKPITQAVRDGVRQLRDTFVNIRRYATVFRFLIARWIYSDGLATLFALGGVYAAGTFDMTAQEVLLFGVVLNVAAGLGAAAFAWITDWLGARRTILLSLIGLTVPGVLILLVEAPLYFWALGFALGLFVGPVQSASRALLAALAPRGLQKQMFGFEAVSERATAFLGPLLVGWLTYLSGSQRIGMSVIIVYFAVGFLLMLGLKDGQKQDRAG